jgi:hypothetical protein
MTILFNVISIRWQRFKLSNSSLFTRGFNRTEHIFELTEIPNQQELLGFCESAGFEAQKVSRWGLSVSKWFVFYARIRRYHQTIYSLVTKEK